MALLEVEDLAIHFGGVLALDGVDFSVEKGEILGIIGPNGAGKTTIFNCINRLYDPHRGKIRFKGKDLLRMKPSEIAPLGIARTFQNVELFPYMTALENLLLARHCHLRTGLFSAAFFLPAVRREEMEARRRVEEIMELLELEPAREATGSQPALRDPEVGGDRQGLGHRARTDAHGRARCGHERGGT
jgi:branched-chain amino acid transport system ATP-binding protein